MLTLLLALPVITFPLGLAGLLHVGEKIVSTRKASMRDYFAGIKQLGGRLYVGVSSLLFLGMCCHWAWRFYSLQSPLLRAMGCTITLLTAAAALSLGYLMPLSLARGTGWKKCLAESASIVLERPADVLKHLVGVLIAQCFLILTGAGFVAFGFLWPLLASLLFCVTPPYQEDRSLKDFFIPSNLIK